MEKCDPPEIISNLAGIHEGCVSTDLLAIFYFQFMYVELLPKNSFIRHNEYVLSALRMSCSGIPKKYAVGFFIR